MAIQAITMPHDRMLTSRNTLTWVQKYIFPGGLLPSTQAIADITERHTALRTIDTASLRPHYAQTLRLWRERFCSARVTGTVGLRRRVKRIGTLLGLLGAGFRRLPRRLPVDVRT
ncbi:mycolic acid cyclopropane synthetase family protein [Mycobacterium ulcerans str. Harvey]|uniref:Mycolic acid cyclopropane synthetase family protein n=1 Tax=Mycobacterium ulcerans str. Harvey TaxID=1299332 RepID=A0ABN0RAQ6_MYCUL|nr:mycolic acid cyclopropane synthetase family protein [Mycobacterium ulcerans str. Harvey]